MAKVIAPLQSFSASGKIGKSLVFFSHLGRNVVRGLVTPSNPQTEVQGNQRLLVGGIARSSKAVVYGSKYHDDVLQVVSAGQTWNSDLVRDIVATYGTGATGMDALQTAFDAQTATNWEAQGILKGLATVTISYAGTIKDFTPGMQLFVLAVHAFNIKAVNPTLFARVPYTTALASFDNDDVVDFAEDLADLT